MIANLEYRVGTTSIMTRLKLDLIEKLRNNTRYSLDFNKFSSRIIKEYSNINLIIINLGLDSTKFYSDEPDVEVNNETLNERVNESRPLDLIISFLPGLQNLKKNNNLYNILKIPYSSEAMKITSFSICQKKLEMIRKSY